MRARLDVCLRAVNDVLLGKQSQVRLAMACLLARGHLLIEDLPGMGKTTLSHALARVMGLEFQRIQFTSDLLPGDILGTSVFDKDSGQFAFHPGPIFAELILADEINRATPKSQSALLEAMEEGQVTIEGATRPLPDPFFVVATQNPVSSGGTFSLPESQLDRFLMRYRWVIPRKPPKRPCCWAIPVAICWCGWSHCSTGIRWLIFRMRWRRFGSAMHWSIMCCDWSRRPAHSRSSPGDCRRVAAWQCWQRRAPGRFSMAAITSSPKTSRRCCLRWLAIVCASVPMQRVTGVAHWCNGCCAKCQRSDSQDLPRGSACDCCHGYVSVGC